MVRKWLADIEAGRKPAWTAKKAPKLPSAIRHELNLRIKESEATLGELHVRSEIWRQLVPFVRWTPSGTYVDLPEPVERALIRELGERYLPLSESIDPPTPKELRAEIRRLMAEHDVDDETASAVARVTLAQRKLEKAGRAPRLMRELPPAWEAATSAAIAAAALENPSREVLGAARAYFERLDDVRRYDTTKVELSKRVKQPSEHGGAGGQGGAGKPKRPHSQLVRYAVDALVETEQRVSAATVRLLLKCEWKRLAFEWGDPLYDIVDVQVQENGPVIVEYTQKWAARHHGKRFIELGASALGKALKRAKPKAG